MTPTTPVYRPPLPGESGLEAYARQRLNKRERDAWSRYCATPCARCRMVRFHVSHEMDPDNSAEGPEYHRDFAHHAFEEPKP